MTIPANLSRVPNLLASGLLMSSISRGSRALLQVQSQLATGKLVSRPSDDAVRATTIAVFDDRLERAEQLRRNLGIAGTTLGVLDSSLGEVNDLILEAQGIASGQIGAQSDAQTRATQAVVIESMIDQLEQLANRETNGLHVFGGSTATRAPIERLYGGFRYTGRGAGLVTDLELGDSVPVTIGGANAIGETSARLRSGRDLSPALDPGTRLTDLSGARGLGVSSGTVEMRFGAGPAVEIDLNGAENVQDIVDRLTSAITQYETDNGVTILGAGGVGVSDGSFTIDVAPGPDSLQFADVGQGVVAEDLGLSQASFSAGVGAGADTAPRLTTRTPLSAVGGLTLPMGSIRIRFQTSETSVLRDVDLSGAETIDDVRNLIETAVPGVRVRVNTAGTGIELLSEVSGPRMSVEEVPGGADTASELGIRSLDTSTSLDDFNHGLGVGIVTGSTDPETGAPNPEGDVDFSVTLGNGDSFSVDLRPEDLATVQTLLDRINSQAADAVAAGDIPAGAFVAELTDGPNGITFRDAGGLGPIEVERQNNSPAARDLGLLDGSWDAGSASLIAQDRATVRVDNVFTALIELRDALGDNSSSGITFAGEHLGSMVDRVSSARALVGTYASRVERQETRLEDLSVLDGQLRSELQDLDFAEASVRYNLLQTQLQAAMLSGSRAQQLSLLDFLG